MSSDRRQQFPTGTLHFWGEQDGPPERELKERLIKIFENGPNVKAAYLANVTYGSQQVMNVALCLQADSETQEPLARQIAGIFASLFGRHEHLDIIFLSRVQEATLVAVCPPFYDARIDSIGR